MPEVSLHSDFDAVVMLTWSDWHREPRSNRYHYAVRFARELPVIFVQPDAAEPGVTAEKVEGHDITILHVSDIYGPEQSRALADALHGLGVRRPLLWIYNVFFEHFIRRANARLRVYHATEDYLTTPDRVAIAGSAVIAPLKRVLQEIDLLVPVSEGVAASYRQHGGYHGPTLVVRNGCDFDFWRASGACAYRPAEDGAKVALFQGGINQRLDYDLLLALSEALPAWQFWFCGKSIDAPSEWARLKKRANIRDLGLVDSETIAALSAQALVGLIPFKQEPLMRGSLPLKAYEYVACGLPVVTIPIDELESRPDLFSFATSAAEFAATIEALAPTRTDAAAIARRLETAALQSYDNRFAGLRPAIRAALHKRRALRSRANLLVLYDDRSTHVRTIEEHLAAFPKYSRHAVFFMPATGFLPGVDDQERPLDLGAFDALLVHYSVRLSIEEHLSRGVAAAIARYTGPKLLFIQDEYDTTETARRWIEQLGINAVFTNVPPASVDVVYPRSRFPNVDFVPTLTGYVPEDTHVDAFAAPLEQRKLLIGYRGRKLPYQYGDLGYEKYRIGVDVRRLADQRGLPVDIEVDDSRRIYGDDWYRFLGSCRATLGTESGANVFDFDGALGRLAASHSAMPYEEFRALHLGGHEGLVKMNQVSPKIFEAIRLRTALVLFDGEYSGVVRPDEHFIPLRKDYSNIDEVFAKLQDLGYLRQLTERAYRDVIESGRYSYQAFVAGVDDYLDARFGGPARAQLISPPAFITYGRSGEVEAAAGEQPPFFLISNAVLGRDPTRESYVMAVHQLREAMRGETVYLAPSAANIPATVGNIGFLTARYLWSSLPEPARAKLATRLRGLARSARTDPTVGKAAAPVRWALRRLPSGLRNFISHRLR